MTRRFSQSFGLVGLLALLATAASAWADPPIAVDPTLQDEALLRYRFTEGETQTYRTEIDQRMTMGGAALGSTSETTMHLVLDAVHTVTSVDEAGAGRLQQQINAATVNVAVNGQSLPADDLARQLNGIAMGVELDTRGEVIDVTMSPTTDPQAAQMMQLVEESMRRSTIEFPEEAVAVGGTWTRSTPLEFDQPGMAMQTSVDTTYTLLGYADVDGQRCAVLQNDVTLSVSGTFSDMGLDSSADGSGSGTGYTYFAVELGALARSSMDMTLDTTVVAEGIELTQAIAMTMSVTRLSDEAPVE